MACLKYSLCFTVIFSFGINVEANQADLPDAVNAQLEFLVQRLHQLEERNDATERKIETMQKEYKENERTMAERISKLERQNDILRKAISNTMNHKDVEKGSNGLSEYRNASRPLGKDMDFTEADKNEIKTAKTIIKETGNQRIRAAPEREVAFFATVTPHDVLHLGENQNLVFDHAVTNTGNAYHQTHGIFTAPVDGTYVFSTTVAGIGNSGDKTYYAYFDVSGQNVARFIAHQYEQSTHMVVLHLKAGDDVSVKNARADDHILGAQYSSFSGFLLYQDFGSSGTVVGK